MTIKRALFLLFSSVFLASCGGGGGGGGGSGGTTVSGSAVDGLMANATVTVYAWVNGQGADPVATGETDAAGAITGIKLGAKKAPYYIEVEADGDTIDVTTGVAPKVTKMTTILTADQLADIGTKPIYVTPLTTIATEMALSRTSGTETGEELEAIVAAASSQTVAALGFGLGSDVSIFTTAPVITGTTALSDIADVVAYRAAIEALVDVLTFASEDSTNTSSIDDVLDGLVKDLEDGLIDGKQGATTLNELVLDSTDITAKVKELPGFDSDDIVALLEEDADKVADIEGVDSVNAILLAAGSLIGDAVTEASGVTIIGGDDSPDTDGDGTDDVDDAFPFDDTETKDSDEDSIGDNADNCPSNSNTDQLNTDGDDFGDACDDDDDGDGTDDVDDDFPLNDAADTDTDEDGLPDEFLESCNLACQQASGLTVDTDDDDDGVPDVDDDFPLDETETKDTDGDGTGDNADADDDGDGVSDINDRCITADNDLSADADGDGCDDADEDPCLDDATNSCSAPVGGVFGTATWGNAVWQ